MTKEGLSLVDLAEIILKEAKEPLSIYDIFDKAAEMKEIPEEFRNEKLTQFYADMTVSAKFVYTGENMWDIKENQKIELWEKDGSFFKEYTEVIVPEEYLQEEKKAPVVEAKPVVKEEPKVEEVVEAKPVETPEVKEEVKVEETVTPVVEQPKTEENQEEYINDEFDEDLFDDFDEDKYNEYMDTYEDQYED